MSYVQISLPNGAVALVEVAEDADLAGPISSPHQFDFSVVGAAIQGAAEVVLDAVKRISPTKATVELNVHFEVREGILMAAFIRGGSKGSVKVAFEWAKERARSSGGKDDGAPDDESRNPGDADASAN